MKDDGWKSFAASGAVTDYLDYCARRGDSTQQRSEKKERGGFDNQTDQDQRESCLREVKDGGNLIGFSPF